MNIKSPEAFRTISEVSKDLSLPQHVLRFWETKFVQIRPIKRGGGRRYYRPEDIKLLKGIKSLLYKDGYTIRGVQKVIKEIGTKNISVNEIGNKSFTDIDKNNNQMNNDNITQHQLGETKRKKLMKVLNDLVDLRKKIDQSE
ncbi:MerR family transcriptional regulator [Pelagibacteraceae bacterium]|nr:MerR family transcriptional regulator [Pelagibacteraceae bacterium]